MLVRALQALLDAPRKKKVPVSCKRVFHNALLDCCSQLIAESEKAPPVRVETTPEPSHHPAP